MADITDIANEFIRDEIEEFIERDEERERIIGIFAQASEQMQNIAAALIDGDHHTVCLLYTSPSPRDGLLSRMPSSA